MTGHINVVKANVREQLLDTGLQVLHERGFNATSVQDITEAAGVPKGSFYNHFESKEDLGAEVVSRYLEKAAIRPRPCSATLSSHRTLVSGNISRGSFRWLKKKSSVAAACWVILEPNFPSKAR